MGPQSLYEFAVRWPLHDRGQVQRLLRVAEGAIGLTQVDFIHPARGLAELDLKNASFVEERRVFVNFHWVTCCSNGNDRLELAPKLAHQLLDRSVRVVRSAVVDSDRKFVVGRRQG